MPEAAPFTRLASLKTAAAFREYAAGLGLELPCDDAVLTGAQSPLTQPIEDVPINGKRPFNRWAIQPMEGWDGTPAGGITDEVRRRWQRFGESGAAILCGGEAMAVRPDGRANPHQLIIGPETARDLAELVETARAAHRERYGAASAERLIIGFQLTHSGRFCRPHEKTRPEPRVAFRHPLLDRRFGVESDAQVFTDDDLERLREAYVVAARVARAVGADFVDLKHCHGYLLHELLGAHSRPGRYGGSFENRTRFLRELVAAIRADGNPMDLAVRLSAFDFVPFRSDPARSAPGRPGPGIPEDFRDCLPYRYGFGVRADHPLEPDLTETFRFAELCLELDLKLLNLSAGSPYYNPHIQRPAMYPPSDGYQPPEDPLVGVARQVQVVKRVKEHLRQIRSPKSEIRNPKPAGGGLVVVGSAYSYLQEFLPLVAQAVLRAGWVDVVGLGRAVLSYPTMLADAVQTGRLESRQICRTFSDCTTAPRNGLISGCYPLDPFYSRRPEAQQIKVLKRGAGGS